MSLPIPGQPDRRDRLSISRIGAMVLRHWYLLRSSWPRLIELIYWPTVQMVTWGFVQIYVSQHSSFFATAAGTFVGGMLLWDVLVRGQQGFAFAFLEELWARNLGNILMSPLRPSEFILSLMIVSLIRLAVGMIPVTLLAIPMFGFNLWGLGGVLAIFFANLIFTAWSVGILVAGLLLRQGVGAENLAWSIMFLFVPISCVYYPVATLPAALQPIAWMLPPTYVFEGMRAVVIEHQIRVDLMVEALAINGLYLAGALAAFFRLLASARRHGTLLSTGE